MNEGGDSVIAYGDSNSSTVLSYYGDVYCRCRPYSFDNTSFCGVKSAAITFFETLSPPSNGVSSVISVSTVGCT